MKLKAGVIIPGAKNEPLRLLDPRREIQHSPDTWAQCMDWDLLTGDKVMRFDLNQYDLLLANGNIEMLDLFLEVRDGFANKLIFLVEGPESMLSYQPTETKIKYIRSLRVADAVGTLNYNFEWFKLYTEKPVFWLGVPFFPDKVAEYSMPIDKRKHIWAMGSNINSHNTIASIFVAQKAGVNKVFIQEFKNDYLSEYNQLGGFDFIEKHDPLPWIQFLKQYSIFWGAIILSNESTWGRFALDFAALGIPVVGSNRQFSQNILFPTLAFDPYNDINSAIAAVRKIEKDLDYYKSVVSYAQHQLQIFSPDSSRKRMNSILKVLFGE